MCQDMDLLDALIVVSEKAANIARLCRHDGHLFQLLVQKKSAAEANPRFVDDFKTLADVLIQQLVKHDIGDQFPELRDFIQGEETNVFQNTLGQTIAVEIQADQQETATLLREVLNGDERASHLLASEVHRQVFLDQVNTTTQRPEAPLDIDLEDLAIWIDPIDSTAEYINGTNTHHTENGIKSTGLECVTVLIGAYSKTTHLPCLGVVNQPFVQHSDAKEWSGRCYWGVSGRRAEPLPAQLSTRTVCVSSSESPEIVARLQGQGFQMVEAAGAGYKILTVISGLADAYILTKDTTFKWDTCGPQAILRFLGGDILVYDEAIKGRNVSVLYEMTGDHCNRGGIIAYRNEEVLKEIIKTLT